MFRKFMVNLALKFQGIPYIWGGSNPHVGFDCSGFCIWILQVFNVIPSGDWTAEGLRQHFTPIQEGTTFREGDLVFYGTKTGATHVMMSIGNGLCIGASGGDHTCVTEEIAKQKGAMVKIKQVHYRTDLIGIGSIGIE
jgi:cell wall-associated NlpC family hydrolase